MRIVGRYVRVVWNAEGAAGGAAAAGAGGGEGGQAAAAAPAGGSGGAAAGGQPESWWSKIDGLDAPTSEFLKGKNYPDLNTALRSAGEADTRARSRLSMPDPQKLGEWDGWAALGWTAEAKDYKVGVPDEVKAKYPNWDKAMEEGWRAFAHERKMPAGLAQMAMDFYIDHAGKLEAKLRDDGQRSASEMDQALKTEWGQSYDGNIELAKRAFRSLGVGLDEATALEQLSGSPGLVRLFHKIGSMMSEDKLVAPGGGTGSGASVATAEQAKAELDRLNRDQAHLAIVRNPGHPDYRRANDERTRLMGLMAGGK
jgi:hypothetical protein